jgi:hypothetical protein
MARRSKGKARPKARPRPRTASAATGIEAEQGAAQSSLPEDLIAVEAELAPLAGGDVDVDAERAANAGEEAVGGSVSTPDKDVVDDLGRAVGVERPPTAPVVTAADVLRERDARYWDLEWRARKREEEP